MGMVKMKHVNIYGPETSPKLTLEVLADAGCFHPDHTTDAAAASVTLQENIYEPLYTQGIGLLKDLCGSDAFAPYEGRYFVYKDVKNAVDQTAAQVAQRRGRKTEIEARLATYAQTKLQLYHLTNLRTDMDEIFSCKYLKVRFGRLPKDSYFKLPYYEDKAFTFNEYDFDGEYYWGMYFVPQDHADEVDDIFTSLYFERMWVPDFVHGTPQDALAKLLTAESELEAERKALDNMSDIASPAELDNLRAMTSWLNYESQIFDMGRYVVVLEHSYYISGYTPEHEMAHLEQSLARVHGIKVVEDDDATMQNEPEGAKPPVKLKNRWFARPFEMFVDMYGLPGYGDLDPTSFVAITYAILFGAMFGDVGQGVVLGLVGYFIMYKMLHLAIGLVLTRCSVFSVLFGFIYGSVFGFETLLNGFYHNVLRIPFLPIAVMEAQNINTILITSIGAGVFIITAAILTGIASNMRRHIYTRTVFSVNGAAGLVFYLALVALLVKMAVGINLPFVGTVPFYILCIVIPFLSIYFAEPICAKLEGKKLDETVVEIVTNGFFELFDALLSFASNTMSFLRVGGFVLAHAGMMSVVATLAGMSDSIVVQVIIYVIGNIFVMAMEGLFVAIQVLRLEFYEMFSRFFEADGIPYEPLKIRVAHKDAA